MADDLVIQAGEGVLSQISVIYVNSSVMNGISEKTDATGAIAQWILAACDGNQLCTVYRIPGNVYFEIQKDEQKTMNQRNR